MHDADGSFVRDLMYVSMLEQLAACSGEPCPLELEVLAHPEVAERERCGRYNALFCTASQSVC